MNKFLITIVLSILFVFESSAQNPFRKLSETYKMQNQYFASELSKRTINLYLKEKTPAEDVRNVLENIDNLNVLTFSLSKSDLAPAFINNVYNTYQLKEYQPFKVNRSRLKNQLIFLKERGAFVSNMVLITTNMTNVSIVEIQGKIDLGKIAVLNKTFNINGLDQFNNPAPQDDVQKSSIHKQNKSGNQKVETKTNRRLVKSDKGYKVYTKTGTEMIASETDPELLINGYTTVDDFQSSLQKLNPDCVQSINVVKDQEAKKMGHPNGMIEVLLKGNTNELFTVCEGMLYFGQDGYMQSVSIDDECGPNLLIDCTEKPISEITQLKPQLIKSIKLTTDPRNCKGKMNGEFVVLETK
jgi:hypothetical protein